MIVKDDILGQGYSDWFWPILNQYRDSNGRALSELERLAFHDDHIIEFSPTPEYQTVFMIDLIEKFFSRDTPLTYVEFGTCFGTTFSSILHYFNNMKGIGFDRCAHRFHISQWMLGCVDKKMEYELHQCDVIDYSFQKESIDIVFMDTDHIFEEEMRSFNFFFDNQYLSENFLFLCDDPMHSGTKKFRESIVNELPNGVAYSLEQAFNLFYFYRKGSDDDFVNLLTKNWDTWIDEMEKETLPKVVKLKSGEFLFDVIT